MTPSSNHTNRSFKQTEIGTIPEDWRVSRVGDVAHVHRGGSPRPIQKWITNDSTGLNWIKIGDVGVGAKFIDRTDEKIVPEGAHYSRVVGPGDFLLSNSMSFGRPYILRINGCIHDGWLVLQDYQNEFNREFLYYVLSSKIVLDQYISKAAGSSVLNLNKELVASVLLPTPQPNEQTAIATALSDVDSLIEFLEKLITKKHAIKLGAMQELLTGRRRLPGFPGTWRIQRLADLAHLTMGQSPGSAHYNQSGHGLPLIQGNADLEDRRSISRVWTTQITRTCQKDDLILTVRAPVGSVAIASTDSCLGRGVCALDPISADPAFIYHALIHSEPQWRVLEQGSTFTAANSAQIAQFEIAVAPTREEQTAVATILDDLNNDISAHEALLSKYRSCKQGMMQALLTGRIRLTRV